VSSKWTVHFEPLSTLKTRDALKHLEHFGWLQQPTLVSFRPLQDSKRHTHKQVCQWNILCTLGVILNTYSFKRISWLLIHLNEATAHSDILLSVAMHKFSYLLNMHLSRLSDKLTGYKNQILCLLLTSTRIITTRNICGSLLSVSFSSNLSFKPVTWSIFTKIWAKLHVVIAEHNTNDTRQIKLY